MIISFEYSLQVLWENTVIHWSSPHVFLSDGSRTWFSDGIHFIVLYVYYGATWTSAILSSRLFATLYASLSGANYIHTPGQFLETSL